jgi:hypothetical protein
MSIKAVILAGLSPILYHSTDTSRAANILKKDRFELKPSDGNSAEEAQGKGTYYMSTARTLSSRYLMANVHPFYSLLVLDGVKLGNRLKGKPIDYWGEAFRKATDGQTESEDRIFSPGPFINQASKYIKEIHTLVPRPERANTFTAYEKRMKMIYDMWVTAKQRNIGFYAYDDPKAYAVLNKAKALAYHPDNAPEVPEAEYPPSTRVAKDYLLRWWYLWTLPVSAKGKDSEGWDDDINGAYRTLSYAADIGSLKADLHNAKSSSYDNGTERDTLDKLIIAMRKNSLDVQGLWDALRAKWWAR